jgi:hypothetical protein
MLSIRYKGSYEPQLLYWRFAFSRRLKNWSPEALMAELAKAGYIRKVNHPGHGTRWEPAEGYEGAKMSQFLQSLPIREPGWVPSLYEKIFSSWGRLWAGKWQNYLKMLKK